ECVETMKKLLEFEPELILMSSPNAALKGPKAARELAGNIPTIIVSDAPAKKAIEEFKEKNMGYIIVGCDSMIGARRPFLDTIEMSCFNADLLKVLAITGAFNIITNELNKVIMDMLEGKAPTLPQIEIKATNATEAALEAAEKAIEAIKDLENIIAPFPGGIARSGSKVGSQYSFLNASTNDPLCPTLRGKTEKSLLGEKDNYVYEVILDGANEEVIKEALKLGIKAAVQVPGV
ncbi:unnamed protein product, partial [marine sediment metagenome]